MNCEELREYGIDLNKGLENCMGNYELYKTILTMFLNDPCFEKSRAAFEKGDQRELFALAHELKGTSGNIGLTELYNASIPLVELIRNNDADDKAVTQMFAKVEAAYLHACSGISRILA